MAGSAVLELRHSWTDATRLLDGFSGAEASANHSPPICSLSRRRAKAARGQALAAASEI